MQMCMLCRPLLNSDLFHVIVLAITWGAFAVIKMMAWVVAMPYTFMLLCPTPVKLFKSATRKACLFCAWIKSWLKHHLFSLKSPKRKTPWIPKLYSRQNRYCKRYYIQKSKRRHGRIASKKPTAFPLPYQAAFPASHTVPHNQLITFGPGQFQIGIDTLASHHITNDKSHFIGSPKHVNLKVKGVGMGQATMQGTVIWPFEDDSGQVHHLKLHNVLYMPKLEFCILVPQKWAQSLNQAGDQAYMQLDGNKMTLCWNQGRNTKTVHLEPKSSNLGFIHSAPSFQGYAAFLDQNNITNDIPATCFPLHTVSDDEDSEQEVDNKDDKISESNANMAENKTPEQDS